MHFLSHFDFLEEFVRGSGDLGIEARLAIPWSVQLAFHCEGFDSCEHFRSADSPKIPLEDLFGGLRLADSAQPTGDDGNHENS